MEPNEAQPEKSPNAPKKRGLGGFFLRGLITLAPVVLTIVAFGLLYQMVERYVLGPINSTIYWALETNSVGWKGLRKMGIEPLDIEYVDTAQLPVNLQDLAQRLQDGYSDPIFKVELKKYRDDSDPKVLNLFSSPIYDLDDLAIKREGLRDDVKEQVPPWIGILLSILLVLWLGWIVGGFLGRRLVQRVDQTMHLIPIVKSVYPYSKQLVEFFFAEKKLEFDTVVVIPYPSPHLYSLAFITGNSLRTLRKKTGKHLLSCFIPSSPMPMTGYTIFVESHHAIPIPISVDEALRITMSGGVLVPTREIVEGSLEGEFQAHVAQKQAEQDAVDEENAAKRKRRKARAPKKNADEQDGDLGDETHDTETPPDSEE